MRKYESLDVIHADAQASREQLLNEVRRTFTDQYNAVVTPIGSMSSEGKIDFLSDIDVWVSVPDDVIEEVLRSRNELYANVGSDLATWERPKYAPLEGMHSIVLYDGHRAVPPTEIDYFIAPESQTDYYREYINGTRCLDFEWKAGPDDESLGARLDYAALVTMWAGKYWHRRIDRPAQLEWAVGRFKDVSSEAGICADIPTSAADNLGSLAIIIDSLHGKAVELADHKRTRAYVKIADTIRLLESLDAEIE